ncbi:hypothetical protein C8R43DRAFT_880849 [Mycena crocata]|nr:hypothetical protein C8R43DRAFT_880849 [Mycena crocata]
MIVNCRLFASSRQEDHFLKTSTTAETLSTCHNHNVYGLLWPTLYPYGVGMFDDTVRLRNDLGFKPIMLKSHVQHLLQMEDWRFQTHFTFLFAMHNIQMIRKTSFQSRLAVRRAWWLNAMAAMAKIDDETLTTLTATMADRKAKKDYSKYIPTTPAEANVFELLRYVDYSSDHIEGSASEVLKMRSEIEALTQCSGTMSLFFTLNPADTYKPLSAFTAGSGIDIDTVFANVDSRFTSFERTRLLASNPIAGAQFFKLVLPRLGYGWLSSACDGSGAVAR